MTLRGLVALDAARFTVDLRNATFLGVAALDQILDADAKLTARGCRLEVVNGTSSIEKMLAALDAEHLLAGDPAAPLLNCARAGCAAPLVSSRSDGQTPAVTSR
jgi:anti-anti-sigma regulatory factor